MYESPLPQWVSESRLYIYCASYLRAFLIGYSEAYMDETPKEVVNSVTPGWYTNAESGLQQYWDGSTWSEIPAPTLIEGQPVAPKKSETSDLAVIALVFSFLVPFVGWILGFRARKEIADSQGKKTGGPLATAAIWIGAIVTVGVAAIIALCVLAPFVFDGYYGNRVDDRGFKHYMFNQEHRSHFGGMMDGDQYGSGSVNPRGGMMHGDQGGEEFQP